MHELAALLLPLGGVFNAAPPKAPAAPAAVTAAAPAAFSKGPSVAIFEGYVSSWVRDEGGLPRPLELDRRLTVKMTVPENPGEATTAKIAVELDDLGVGVSFFAVCPHESKLLPDGSCEKLYFQVQTALSGRTKAFCASSLSPRDAVPFPVQQCGAADREDESRTIGVTLHREPFRPR